MRRLLGCRLDLCGLLLLLLLLLVLLLLLMLQFSLRRLRQRIGHLPLRGRRGRRWLIKPTGVQNGVRGIHGRLIGGRRVISRESEEASRGIPRKMSRLMLLLSVREGGRGSLWAGVGQAGFVTVGDNAGDGRRRGVRSRETAFVFYAFFDDETVGWIYVSWLRPD